MRAKFGQCELRMRNDTVTFEGSSYDVTKEWYYKLRGCIHALHHPGGHKKGHSGAGKGEEGEEEGGEGGDEEKSDGEGGEEGGSGSDDEGGGG